MADRAPLPVAGYTNQSADRIELVNHFKEVEERLLREIDVMFDIGITETRYDNRWLAIARNHLEQGFMALNRSVFRPERIALPNDENKA
ncbi:cyclic nucleotide-binding protein [Aurantiacibacter xanthus]|uniref:Cyclic nucleotide-binding protein n=1 Tax=Aurantiacibacter xanthus TaxID=1784712 RepID=A0A3A1P1Z2_9SPHN|nr:cyclic nucleotide-binding protein [Aurantiacibacter xanthus]RIV82954.1 cyclic nucleotide-binding protein [Aurantiacibacter xanthus]